jgi:hypothetical protein
MLSYEYAVQSKCSQLMSKIMHLKKLKQKNRCERKKFVIFSGVNMYVARWQKLFHTELLILKPSVNI